jgi:pyruvate/2-oxoglutarate dehydrogenase complex dihydrolipoamide acyltransferase (E2) component
VAKVTMPQLGESVAEGTIGKWLKQPGDTVAKYEPLLEVITDKVNAEVPSPFEGVLKEILAEEGATVPNNAEIAIIETADEAGGDAPAPAALEKEGGPEAEGTTQVEPRDAAAASTTKGPAGSDETTPADAAPTTAPAAAAPAAAAPAAAAPAAPSDVPAQASAASAAAVQTVPTVAAPAGTGDADARMTPAVRRLLREHALRPDQIVGTGGGGRITRDDVLAVVESIRTGGTPPVPVMAQGNGATQGATAPPPAGAGQSAPAPTAPTAPAAPPARMPAGAPIEFPEGVDEVLLPMTQMRKGIAAQMTRALAVPHAYVHMEVDATNLVKAREKAKRDYQAREGISLSYVPFVIKAAVAALREFPAFNAHWTENGVLAKRRVHMGVAVAVDDGLLVPVVRDVDQLSISGLNRAIADVAARARAGRLKLDDYGGSTFTIDNTGWFGSNLTMPIINVPEVAILTMEAITKRAVVLDTPDGDVIAIRPIMNMVLAIDHRANDGAQAAALLKSIKTWLESVGPDTPVY